MGNKSEGWRGERRTIWWPRDVFLYIRHDHVEETGLLIMLRFGGTERQRERERGKKKPDRETIYLYAALTTLPHVLSNTSGNLLTAPYVARHLS